jgi:malate dehydrogenase (oxaloacetate-decarboxylating)
MPLDYHRENKGKIEVSGTVPLETEEDLSKAYTPGVAEAVKEIQHDPSDVYTYTAKGRMVGVVTDGSSVLGLGNVGPAASIPVMEGKCLLIREIGGVSAFPVVLDEPETDAFIDTVERLHPMYGFLMLEDIASPKCFRAEDELKERLTIPVFHDDQHGAAIVVLAALKNALELAEKNLGDAKIVIIGAGAAGIGTAKLLLAAGAEHILMVDKPGILHADMDGLNWAQQEIAAQTNPDQQSGTLADAIEDADVLIGLSAPDIVSKEMVRSMAADPIVFALANPEPEIMPDDAKEAGAFIVGTGRSDEPNQINNSVVFPGIVKGCLNCFASDVNTAMQLAAADAIAAYVEDPQPDSIIPSSLNEEVVDLVAQTVTEKGQETGACRIVGDYNG